MLTIELHHLLSHFVLNVSFKVKNEIAVLSGPSGSGKTTILNAISGLMKVDKGNIKLNENTFLREGKSIVPVQKRRIGYVFQNYALFPHRTIWQNIQYGMEQSYETETIQLMKDLGISHLKEQYPHEVSGGEKQRTALIRALATAPELLLLDEPFSALDEKTKSKSHHQLVRIHREWKIPILLVTHNRQEAEYLASKIMYIEEGKITGMRRMV